MTKGSFLYLLKYVVVIVVVAVSADRTSLRDASPFSLDIVIDAGNSNGVQSPQILKFLCGNNRAGKSNCTSVITSFCDSIEGGDPRACATQLRNQIRWRKPHLTTPFPHHQSEISSLVCETSRTAVSMETVRSARDPIFRTLWNRRVDRVLVLSFYTGKNFGDRLGVPIVHSLLPPHVQITHTALEPCPNRPTERCPVLSADEVRRGKFDVVLVGTGMSLYRAALTDELFEILRIIPVRIGFFGSQYHEEMPDERMRSLVNLLDVWFARYRDDKRRYGSVRNTVHLGDWMITACPLRPRKSAILSNDVVLYVPPNTLYDEVALDRYIQGIQSVSYVFSGRLHPLLCALASSRAVAYAEQREHGTEGSGKFSAMLDDVFGFGIDEAAAAENTWFRVDRRCVVAYKRKIAAQMSAMREIFDSWTSDIDEDNNHDDKSGRSPSETCRGDVQQCGSSANATFLGHVKPVYYAHRP